MIEDQKAGVFLFNHEEPETVYFACHGGVTKRGCHKALEAKYKARSWHHLRHFIYYLGNSVRFNWKKDPKEIEDASGL